MKIETIDERENPQELLPQIVERIFAICKNDENFKLKDDLKHAESVIEDYNQKIEKQDDLLEQSNKLKKDLIDRLQILTEQNERQQMKLLESIGGEL